MEKVFLSMLTFSIPLQRLLQARFGAVQDGDEIQAMAMLQIGS